jgi:hypothetical protein
MCSSAPPGSPTDSVSQLSNHLLTVSSQSLSIEAELIERREDIKPCNDNNATAITNLTSRQFGKRPHALSLKQARILHQRLVFRVFVPRSLGERSPFSASRILQPRAEKFSKRAISLTSVGSAQRAPVAEKRDLVSAAPSGKSADAILGLRAG